MMGIYPVIKLVKTQSYISQALYEKKILNMNV